MIITIGAFDGFHLGHKILLDTCKNNAVNKNDWAVISFWPNPGIVTGKISGLLFDLEERNLIAQALNVPEIITLNFDDALKNSSPENFWNMLKNKIHVTGLVLGKDFKFGFQRSGSAEKLAMLAKNDGVEKILILELFDKQNYSSSAARKFIINGKIKDANKILGYPFFIYNHVIKGNQRGRTMNYPTANLNFSREKIIPSDGVYSAAVLVKGEWYCGAVSIGKNPTFGDINNTRVEAHILDFNEDIYGEKIGVFFLDKVRDLIKFDDKNSLAQQISHDLNTCTEIYKNEFNRFALSFEFGRAAGKFR